MERNLSVPGRSQVVSWVLVPFALGIGCLDIWFLPRRSRGHATETLAPTDPASVYPDGVLLFLRLSQLSYILPIQHL